MQMYKFINNCQADHLTIADVKKLQPGDTLDVVIWDRNFEESWIWDNAENLKHYDPEIFFKNNRHQLTYCGDMDWKIKFNFGETIYHTIHLNVSHLDTYWTWVAIDEKDGYIHITDESVRNGHKIPEHWKPKHIHWSEFPETTRAGWRGPIMLWSKLKDMPQVYNEEGVYDDSD